MDPVDIYELDAGLKRPVVVCECSYKNKFGEDQDIIIATVHLTANEKKAADELEQLYLDFSHHFGDDKAWIIMGDLNCEGNKINPDFKMQVSYSSYITHQSGKKLDFAVYSKGLANIANIEVEICTNNKDEVVLASDHYPIRVDFE